MKNIKIEQIIVVTDGRSNVGGDPIAAAREAAANDITVSAIGIINKSEVDESPIEEIQKIAQCGKGQWELTHIENLSATLQMVTQRTVNKTLSTVVNKQLKDIMGAELNEISPTKRNKFIEYIENLSDEIHIKCCVLMDCSGSMKPKIHKARESIIDLMNSINSRKGRSEIAVIAFPGDGGDMTNMVSDFTGDVEYVKNQIYNMMPNGTTPTAPAIYRAIELFASRSSHSDKIAEEEPLFADNIV